MAVGDTNDMAARVRAVLPQGWFPQTAANSPVLNALLSGIGWSLSWIFALIGDAYKNILISTAQSVWLDLHAYDYFGPTLQRKHGQHDASFRAVILANMTPSGATRGDLSAKVEALTGSVPLIIEPANTGDTGGYGTSQSSSVPLYDFTFLNGWTTKGGVTGPSPDVPATLIDGPNTSAQTTIAQYQTSGTVLGFSIWVYLPDSLEDIGAFQIQVNGAAVQTNSILGKWVKMSVTLSGAQQNSPLITFIGGTVDFPPAIFYLTSLSVTYEGGKPAWTGLAYDNAGYYGALNLPFQFFIRVARPVTGGVANVDGYGGSIGGYGVGSIEYVDTSLVANHISDSAIYETISNNVPAGTIAWTQIT